MEFDAGIPMSRAAAAAAAVTVTEGASLSPSSLNEGLPACACVATPTFFLFFVAVASCNAIPRCRLCFWFICAWKCSTLVVVGIDGCLVMVNCRFRPFPLLHLDWISVETSFFFLYFGFQK
jgi:hypothetical protein